ncbi:hypothetical protein [Caldivirga sp. UBA161]|uniref:hypothetical protein n=1 Tax=Caldivirga sp. UBA161 TaxID=1915569 RepID=UPI0025C69E90|nr:hypothetical protein [Caldivirga sp. UBA161]
MTEDRPFNYMLHYNGEACAATIWDIPFMMQSYEVYAEAHEACRGVYLVSVNVSPMNTAGIGTLRESVWMVLVKVQ